MAKAECTEWVNTAVTALACQLETMEADLELLAGKVRVCVWPCVRARACVLCAGALCAARCANELRRLLFMRSPQEHEDEDAAWRVEELQGHIARHREYVAKLEQVLRLLENEQVRHSERLAFAGGRGSAPRNLTPCTRCIVYC